MPKKETPVVESDTENVIKTTDVEPSKLVAPKPESFNDLSREELERAANWFGSETEGTDEEIIADLDDFGVTWNMYAREFKVEGYEHLPPQDAVPPRQVDESDLLDGEVEVTEPITQAPVTLAPAEKYLIKFIGENPYFERGKYRFTTDRPYAVMPATDAQRALVEEPTKFRQAFPAELAEFYS